MNTALVPATAPALIAWSPGAGDVNQFMLQSPAELAAKLPQFDRHSALLPLSPNAVVQSPELHRYAPAAELPVKSTLPPDVAQLLGWPVKDSYTPGAYQN